VIARSVRIARTAIGEYIRRAADLLAVTDIRIGEAIGLIVTTDYPPTVARLATASTKRVTEDCPPKNLRERDHHPISCTGGRSLSIWLRSSAMLAWRKSSREELDMRCRGTQCNNLQGTTLRVWIAMRSIRPSTAGTSAESG
jgi:hypothetical protein